MKGINLYYKDNKINNRPLTFEELKKIMENEYIYKRNEYTGYLEKIPVKNVSKIKTIII